MSETIHVDEKFIMSRFEDAFVICGAFDGTPKTLSYPKRIEVAVQRVGPRRKRQEDPCRVWPFFSDLQGI